MNTITIHSITSTTLCEKKYQSVLPEYYDLATVTENNLWHDNQNVLDHVIGVFEGLERVLQFKNLPAQQTDKLKRYLGEQRGNVSRQETLIVATLLHDIAKKDTLVQNKDGTANCPGHELIGAGRVATFAERFDLNTQAAEHVERIVRFHGLISDILTLIIANSQKEKYLTIFQETVGDVAIELVLLMQADLFGCDLEKGDKKAYDDRVTILSWMLTELS